MKTPDFWEKVAKGGWGCIKHTPYRRQGVSGEGVARVFHSFVLYVGRTRRLCHHCDLGLIEGLFKAE